jgi:adenylate cyclase
MLLRLKTVKAKLTALVGLSIVVMLAALPILSWVLHQQMIDEVDDRASDAKKSFLAELEDDLADVKLAARILAKDEATRRALTAHDPVAAREMAATFLELYPSMDVLLFDVDGALVAQVGCSDPPTRLEDKDASPHVVDHGCEKDPKAPPAIVLSYTAPGVGTVFVCMPLDDAYAKNSADKLGVAVALQAANKVARSSDFPHGGIDAVRGTASLEEIADKTWALARFDPDHVAGLSIVTALDVTDVQNIIRKNLLFALGVLAFAALVSVVLGSRLASIMSVALARVNDALKKLEQQEYVHVQGVQTGDELEDLAAGFNTMVDGLKERDKLKTTMGKYMTASVMDHLLGGKVALGGETLTVTILFSDIRSFTTISEKMQAQDLVGLLNEYFSEMVGIVMDNDGVVDKYIGDAIMAVFGAPVPKPNDAVHAVTAAVRMRQALAKLNVSLKARGLQTLRTGIGIHTGEVVAGNIGSERRMEYTVIGDAVNLASRLESNTKELGVNVLISEDTYALVKHVVTARPVREITVKGRAKPVMTYEVTGLNGEAPVDVESAHDVATHASV